FEEDDHGVVIAESQRDDLEPYLGLHYPATDVPSPARQLYILNGLRLIPDRSYHPVEIIPSVNPATGRPLDMTYAGLRSVSPVHLSYLKHADMMGFLSISIVRGERLWGVIMCHSEAPRYLAYDIRMACEFLGEMLSLQLAAKEETESAATSREVAAVL